jgi:hypothetical protein
MFIQEANSRRERHRSWLLAMGQFVPQAAVAQVEAPAYISEIPISG